MVAGCRELVHRKEQLIAEGGFEPPTFDFIKSSASSDLSTLGSANDQGLGRKEAEHVDYRLRLSPERTANRMGRYGNWRVRRAPADTQRWGGRAVLPRAEEKRNQRARMDVVYRALALVRALARGTQR